MSGRLTIYKQDGKHSSFLHADGSIDAYFSQESLSMQGTSEKYLKSKQTIL